ncbi:DegT/DnrJ/EryC1/StrS family aminotransferase [Bryobacter aggregatus]|uniref:DegT/DnrJ/EryC1/StrS family aminotransferase n=1 Tax=Bryobacter aggregatus TaxID=360054 RepID=UPI0004E1FB1F|nr:DegT/DnrJ/EryC1/StrS family aminotransferase [Bryobacter aggregatus]
MTEPIKVWWNEYGFMVQDRVGTMDEVILSVLAPAEVVAGIAWQGLEPVFADLDPETMSLTTRTVTNQVTVYTKAVLVTPNVGVLGNWETLGAVTEPRGISLQVEGEGIQGKWERIAPGVEGMGDGLLRIDRQLIYGGAEAFAELLGDYLIDAKALPEWRGKDRDYPGMASLKSTALRVADWRTHLQTIKKCAVSGARQQSFQFDLLPKPATSARPAKRRAVRASLAG